MVPKKIPPRNSRSGIEYALALEAFGWRPGLFVLFTVITGAAGRSTGCHHELANFLAFGPATRLRHVIVRAIDHLTTPQKRFFGLGVDEIGGRKLGLDASRNMHVAHGYFLGQNSTARHN